MDDIMSGEFNARKTIDKMSKEIRDIKKQKEDIEQLSKVAFDKIKAFTK